MTRPPVIPRYISLTAKDKTLRIALKIGDGLFYALNGTAAVHDDRLHVTQSLSGKTLKVVRDRSQPFVEIVRRLSDGFQRCLRLCDDTILVVARQKLVGLG